MYYVRIAWQHDFEIAMQKNLTGATGIPLQFTLFTKDFQNTPKRWVTLSQISSWSLDHATGHLPAWTFNRRAGYLTA